MDPATPLYALTTAIAMAGAFAAGRAGRPKAPSAIEAVCPCKHAISFHEGLTGRCHGKVEQSSVDVHSRYSRKWVECDCQHYAGPELISALTMRPLLPLDVPQIHEGTDGPD